MFPLLQAKLIPAARVHVGIQAQAALPDGAPLMRPEVLQLVGPPPDKAAALQRRTQNVIRSVVLVPSTMRSPMLAGTRPEGAGAVPTSFVAAMAGTAGGHTV